MFKRYEIPWDLCTAFGVDNINSKINMGLKLNQVKGHTSESFCILCGVSLSPHP